MTIWNWMTMGIVMKKNKKKYKNIYFFLSLKGGPSGGQRVTDRPPKIAYPILTKQLVPQGSPPSAPEPRVSRANRESRQVPTFVNYYEHVGRILKW